MDQFTGPPAEFTDATFVPYGLDERWSGLRWFGGSGSSGSAVTNLVLAFGDAPWDPNEPEVRIETRRADLQSLGDPTVEAQIVAGQMAREQVGHLWRETGVLRDDVRRAAFPIDGVRGDPTVGWDHATLSVDGETVSFSSWSRVSTGLRRRSLGRS